MTDERPRPAAPTPARRKRTFGVYIGRFEPPTPPTCTSCSRPCTASRNSSS
ncbi:hypothetical protein [Deinococcus aquaticus]|uniref:hypothetical protein n=1 Tax=Deinococcus aquaticus TaxID=328692 RepID=UPI00361E4622